MSTIRPNSKSRNPRLPPKPQLAPEELSARQRKRQAKLARRATNKKQYQVRYIGTYFEELRNQTAIAIDDGNTAYLMCQFDDRSLLVTNGDPEKIEHHWGFSWHEIPRKDLQRVSPQENRIACLEETNTDLEKIACKLRDDLADMQTGSR